MGTVVNHVQQHSETARTHEKQKNDSRGLPWLYNAVIWTTYQNQLSYSLKVTLVFCMNCDIAQ